MKEIVEPKHTLRLRAAAAAGRLAGKLLQISGQLGLPVGGTNFPGQLALKIDPHILPKLLNAKQGVIIITGTNGKTTTASLTVKLLEGLGLTIASNRQGANLLPGLVTALLSARQPTAGQPSLAVLEADEGILLPLSQQVKNIDLLLVGNLFPDQIDRHGSVGALAKKMKAAAANWPEAILVLNADDPETASFGIGRQRVHYYGLQGAASGADYSYPCPVCQQPLVYTSRTYAHLGQYRCHACGFARPDTLIATGLTPSAENPDELLIRTADSKNYMFSTALPGLYSKYNVIAALTLAKLWYPAADLASFRPEIAAFSAPVGRNEHFSWPREKKQGKLVLVKNTAGFNLALADLQPLATDPAGYTLMVVINDLPADGRDISWLQDTDIAALPDRVDIICSGLRAADIAGYFGQQGIAGGRITISPDLKRAVQMALAAAPPTVIALSNYTPLAALRRQLIRSGAKTGSA